MAAGFARPVHLRGILQCLAAIAVRCLPSLLLQTHLVADAHHRLFGDAFVRNNPAYGAVGHLRAPVSLVRCGRFDPKHPRRHGGILAGGPRDARASRLAHGKPACGRGGTFRQRHEARPLIRARLRADGRACSGVHLSDISIRSGCSPDRREGNGDASPRGDHRSGERRALAGAPVHTRRARHCVLHRARGDEGPNARAGAFASAHRACGSARRVVVPLPGTIRSALSFHMDSLGAVHPAHRSGRQIDRVRGEHAGNLRLTERRSLHRGARRVHRGLGRLANRSRRAGGVGPRAVRDAERHAKPNAHHDGERPCGRAREAERTFCR